MSWRLEKELEHLKKEILEIGALVEEQLRLAIDALLSGNNTQALQVIESDAQVDIREVGIEEDCLKILALYQPVANNLRFVIAVLKINNDLERIGDLAVNVAQRVSDLHGENHLPPIVDVRAMSEKVKVMLGKALDALVKLDSDLARTVCLLDDEVDEMHRDCYHAAQEAIQANPATVTTVLQMVSISRYLERCADQVTNIAEDVIYLVDGVIVRHIREREALNPEEDS